MGLAPPGETGATPELQRVSRLYAVLSRVNQAIISTRDQQELFESACRIAVEDGGFLLAWIGFIDPQTREIRVAASYGRDEGYLDSIKISLDAEKPEGRGPTAIALRECRAFINNDTANNPNMAPWREAQLKRGFFASASFPFIVDGECIGVITLYAPAAQYFDDEENAVLTTLAANFSRALESNKLLRQRAEAIEELRRTRDQLELRVAERTTELRHELATLQILLRVADSLAEWTDLPSLGQSLAEALVELTDHSRSIVDLYDAENDEVRVLGSAGKQPFPPGSTWPLRNASKAIREAVASQTAAVHDLSALPAGEVGPGAMAYRIRKALYVPLVRRGRVIGVIVLDDPEVATEFTEREISLVEAIAAQASVAIENGRLVEAEQRDLARAKLIQEVVIAAAAALTLEELGSAVLDALGRHLGMRAGDLRVIGPDGMLRLVASQGYPDQTREQILEMSVSKAGFLATRSIREGRLITHEEDESTEARREILEQAGLLNARYFVTPVRYGNEVLGTFSLSFAGRRSFTADELDTYRTIVDILGQSIENARLFEAEQIGRRREAERADQIWLLKELAEIGASSLDIAETANRQLDALVSRLELRGAALYMADAQRRELVPAMGAGAASDVSAPPVPMSSSVAIAQVLRTGEPVVIERLDTSSTAGVPDAVIPGAQALGDFPLRIQDELIGTLALAWSEPRPLSPEYRTFLASAAAEIALGVHNAQLFESEREAAQLNEALNVIDHSILGTLDTEEMLQRVVVEAARALHCESSALDIREGEQWVVRHAYNFPQDVIGHRFTEAEVPFAAMAAQTGQPVVVEDSFTDSRVDPEVQRAYNVKSVMVVPLAIRGEMQALLFFNYHEHWHRFSEQEISFGRRLSASLALAIENARLYEKEHLIADRLQEALLSLPADVPGVDFAYSYHSATEAARVGGDFYDIFELSHDHVGLLIGDVAGKGLDASVLTSMVKNTIRAHANERGKTARQVLSLTNDVVFKATPTDAFVTVFFGILDCRDGRLVYGNAGHTTAAVVRAGGEVTGLPVTGPILGAFEDIPFEEAETLLSPDDLLFLYTDGMTEARREREFYGEERLFEFLHTLRKRSVQEALDETIADVLDFTGGRLRDDLATLVIRCTGACGGGPHQAKLQF
jgi:GAF domain-containing protein